MSSFEERRNSLFNHLKHAEELYCSPDKNKYVEPQDYGVIDKRTFNKLRHVMKPFRGKESIFKRPVPSLRDCLRARTIPDHIINPQKWVYYNLSDVTPEQMSDATNTATALALIQKLEKEAEETPKMESDSEEIFKKPTFHYSRAIKQKSPNEKPVYKCGKVIMPEYVVGMSNKKERMPKKELKSNQETINRLMLKLNHLYDEDD